MKYNVIKNWVESFELMTRKPLVLIPFLIWGLFEALALEFIYFSSGVPLMHVANPVIRKFFGEPYIHYPMNFLIMPKLLYYLQLPILVFAGIFLSSLTIGMVKRLRENKPIEIKNLIKASLNKYLAFLCFGGIIVVLHILAKRIDGILFLKFFGILSKYLPSVLAEARPFMLSLSLTIALTAVNTLFITTVPLMVIMETSLIRSLARSVYQGLRRFFAIFLLLFVPQLVYLPIVLLKSFPEKLMAATFPEIVFLVALAGIFIGKFIECFVMVCVSRFVLDSRVEIEKSRLGV